MKIVITGGRGMLGRTLLKELADHETAVADLPEWDITKAGELEAKMLAEKPDLVIHCAAMTNVDGCESDRETAFLLNGTGSDNVARACKACSARLLAISTDYVFGGDAKRAWSESDDPAPRTVYGASKLAGERAVLQTLPDAVVLRIAWLYGAGGPSFVHTMARLGRQDGAPLKVVNDQHGNPTSAKTVAVDTSIAPSIANLMFMIKDPYYSFFKESVFLSALTASADFFRAVSSMAVSAASASAYWRSKVSLSSLTASAVFPALRSWRARSRAASNSFRNLSSSSVNFCRSPCFGPNAS
jgi:dTDP-4-dehydrorhamnose reductase